MEAPNLLLRGFRETTPRQYLAALAAAGIALALRGLLNPFVPDSHPYTTAFIATAFSVWYAGLWASMLTAAVGWLGAKYLFVPLLYSLRIATREERNSAIAYFLISFAIILFGDLSRRTGGLALEVQDTGKGIPAETLSKISSVGLPGIGLRGMRERVTALGGEFCLKGRARRSRQPCPCRHHGSSARRFGPLKVSLLRCFASPPAALERNRQVIGHSSEFREPRRATWKEHPHEIYSVCSSRIDWPTGPHSSFSVAHGRAG
jgi:hypothetical protein